MLTYEVLININYLLFISYIKNNISNFRLIYIKNIIINNVYILPIMIEYVKNMSLFLKINYIINIIRIISYC